MVGAEVCAKGTVRLVAGEVLFDHRGGERPELDAAAVEIAAQLERRGCRAATNALIEPTLRVSAASPSSV